MKSKANLELSYSNLLNTLRSDYNDFLQSCFSKEYSESGAYNYQRVNWRNFEKAKIELSDSFSQSGIYIWGVEETPLYIGKAVKQSLLKRFSRYVGGEKSICHLAEQFSNHLRQDCSEKLIEEFRFQYKLSRSKAIGVKSFGEAGIDKIWFVLLPLENNNVISGLESSLIAIGRTWNNNQGHADLINLD
jgi:hypothetical protein